MPHGIAVRLGPAPESFCHAGSELYQVFPSLGQFEGRDNHVIVAMTSCAVDHGVPETTVFKCDAHGQTSLYNGLDGGAEALRPVERIVGRHDAESALANLAGSGYLIVELAEVATLRLQALRQAFVYAVSILKQTPLDADDYANNNWGTFAAQHLVQSGRRDQPVQSTNHVFPRPAPAADHSFTLLS